MTKLNTKQLSALCGMMERAIKNKQLQVSVQIEDDAVTGATTSFATTDLFGTSEDGESAELIINPAGLKQVWVRYAGYFGGKKKAANAKKLRRAA
jgi:hypothetical protein